MRFVYNLENLVKVNTYINSALIFLLVFSYINPGYSLAFLTLSIVALYKDFSGKIHIPRIFLNILAILLVFIMALRINISDLILPVVETLLLLLSLKLLEEKKFRDYMQVYLLITLIFAGYSLISISMVFLLYLLIYIFLLNFSIITLTYYTQGENITLTISQLRKIAFKSSIIPILSIPVAVLLFFTIPRTNYPLLNILSQQSKGKTGFSDEVSLGEVSSIQESNEVVMRISMENVGEIYIRGITFNRFDGKKWENTLPDSLKVVRNFPASSKEVSYTAYLEPTQEVYLFTVDFPYSVNLGRFHRNYYPYQKRDLTFITTTPISSRVMYSGVSLLSKGYYEETPLDYYLSVPEGLSQEFIQYSQKLKGKDQRQTAFNIFSELYRYDYSLSDLPKGDNQLDEFLFKKKKGNCEYFATAMAIILRINGIPSRVVGGYRTSLYNEIGKYYLVKEKDAHLWVEAYIDKQWIRLDPTPPVRNQVINTIERPSKLKLLFDSINYYYTAFVVNYDFSKQMDFYRGIKEKISKIPDIKLHLKKEMVVSTFLLLLLIIGLVFVYNYLTKSYEERLLNLFYSRLKKYGYIREKNEGLEDFCSKIKDEDLKNSCLKFVKQIERYIYGGEKLSKSEFDRLRLIVKKIGKYSTT